MNKTSKITMATVFVIVAIATTAWLGTAFARTDHQSSMPQSAGVDGHGYFLAQAAPGSRAGWMHDSPASGFFSRHFSWMTPMNHCHDPDNEHHGDDDDHHGDKKKDKDKDEGDNKKDKDDHHHGHMHRGW